MRVEGALIVFVVILLLISIVLAAKPQDPLTAVWNSINDLTTKVTSLFTITANLQNQISNLSSSPQNKNLTSIVVKGALPVTTPVCCPNGAVRSGCSGGMVIPSGENCCVGSSVSAGEDIWVYCLK